ncbi:hypothetical protein PMAYCL1PPCAC_27114, partial [Pristionchus mayeri]
TCVLEGKHMLVHERPFWNYGTFIVNRKTRIDVLTRIVSFNKVFLIMPFDSVAFVKEQSKDPVELER